MCSFLCFFAATLGYFIHCVFINICLQLVTTSCGFAVNSSYRNIINYFDNLVRISQIIAIICFGNCTGLENSMLTFRFGYDHICKEQMICTAGSDYGLWVQVLYLDFKFGQKVGGILQSQL